MKFIALTYFLTTLYCLHQVTILFKEDDKFNHRSNIMLYFLSCLPIANLLTAYAVNKNLKLNQWLITHYNNKSPNKKCEALSYQLQAYYINIHDDELYIKKASLH